MSDLHTDLAKKADISYKISLVLYTGLIATQLAKVLYWQPPENSAFIIAIATTVPLLLPVYGLLRKQPRSTAWLCFIVCFYFMSGVQDTWLKSEFLYGWLITSFSFLLFICAMMFTRWQGKKNRLFSQG